MICWGDSDAYPQYMFLLRDGENYLLIIMKYPPSCLFLWFALQVHIDFSGSSWDYRKFPKYSDTQNICCNHSKIWTTWLYHRVMSPNNADGIANSVDPDQTAPLGAVWSGSALFAQTCLSKNLGKLRYLFKFWQGWDNFPLKHMLWVLIRIASTRWF